MEAIITSNRKFEVGFELEGAKVNLSYDVTGTTPPTFVVMRANYNEGGKDANGMPYMPGQGTNISMNRTYYPDGTIVPQPDKLPMGQEFETTLNTLISGLFTEEHFLDPSAFIASL